MRLEDIDGKVFVDANIFLYPALDDPRYGESANRFLKRISNGDVIGFTSVLVLNEVLHKLMISEVAKKCKISPSESLRHMKSNPAIISQLEKCWDDIKWIKEIRNLTILDITTEISALGLKYSKDFKLLSSDGVHVATMETHGLTNLASNDSDFERVDWIKLYKPSKKE